MDRMAEAGNWLAVERSFGRLDALGSPHTFDVLVNAAFSARERGDITLARKRLHDADALGDDPQVDEWLWTIEKDYAFVLVAADLMANYRLLPEQMPFSPEHRRAVQFAMQKVEHDGIFNGLLPKGAYRFEPVVPSERARTYAFDLRTERKSIDLRTKEGPTKRDRRRRARLDRKLARENGTADR